MRLPSVRTLSGLVGGNQVKGRQIQHWIYWATSEGGHGRVDEALENCDKILGGFGVEPLKDNGWDGYYQDIGALYVNRGDSYEPTIVYDTREERFLVCSWGDFVEGREGRFV